MVYVSFVGCGCIGCVVIVVLSLLVVMWFVSFIDMLVDMCMCNDGCVVCSVSSVLGSGLDNVVWIVLICSWLISFFLLLSVLGIWLIIVSICLVCVSRMLLVLVSIGCWCEWLNNCMLYLFLSVLICRFIVDWVRLMVLLVCVKVW